jgi:hypothetical protein
MTPQRKLDRIADPEGIIARPEDFSGIPAALVNLVKDIADKLEKLYPGWMWAVQPDHRGGVINIFSWRCSGQWGYRLHTKRVQNDPTRRDAMEAGGEILERFGFRRTAYSRQDWQAAKRYMGLVDMDITDMSQKTQRRRRDDAFSDAVRQGRIKLVVQDEKRGNTTHRTLVITNDVAGALRGSNRP